MPVHTYHVLETRLNPLCVGGVLIPVEGEDVGPLGEGLSKPKI